MKLRTFLKWNKEISKKIFFRDAILLYNHNIMVEKRNFMKRFLSVALFFMIISSVFSFPFSKKKSEPAPKKEYDLTLTQNDISMISEKKGGFVKDGNGYHLYIKKRGDIQSVMLIYIGDWESADYHMFTMRDSFKNSVNGDEIRTWNGTKMTSMMERQKNTIMATKIENYGELGECFHLYIPKNGIYGYVIQNENKFTFQNGQTVKVRTFAKPDCDYFDSWLDTPLELLAEDEKRETGTEFSTIAKTGIGEMNTVTKETLTETLLDIVEDEKCEEKTEIVFVIDATESMKDDFEELGKNWLPKLKTQLEDFKTAKIGLMLYKDYGDSYNYKNLPVKNYGFAKNTDKFASWIKSTKATGGKDEPEAVYEALYATLKYFSWSKDSKKKIILIGDAEPHFDSKEYKDEVKKLCTEKNIKIDCILIQANMPSDEMKIKSVDIENATEAIEKSIIDAK